MRDVRMEGMYVLDEHKDENDGGAGALHDYYWEEFKIRLLWDTELQAPLREEIMKEIFAPVLRIRKAVEDYRNLVTETETPLRDGTVKE